MYVCMYVCMYIRESYGIVRLPDVHVCVSPCILSYGRIRVTGTLRRKRGLSVVEFHTVFFAIQGVRNTGGMGQNLAYDRLTTSSQRTGFHAQHPVHN